MKESLKTRIKKKHLFFLVLLLSLLGLAIKFLFVWQSSTAFTYDQARDLLDLREMWLLRKPRLIGAPTSLHGVFYGPFWYWLCFPFYLLTGGHPAANLIPIFLFSFIVPLIVFILVDEKRLGFILATIYIFSYSFFSHSIIALNTNPIVFLTPIFLIFSVKFFRENKKVFLYLTLFLIGSSFHFEPIIGLFWTMIFLVCSLSLKKIDILVRNFLALIFFLVPFFPQLVFEFRHDFLQTRAFLTLIIGGESSLTPGEGGLSFRFFDRLLVFKNVWFFQIENNPALAIFFFALVVVLAFRFLKLKKVKHEADYLFLISVISLVLVFIGFVIYPYALWPWYLGTIDALMLTLIGLGIYSLSLLRKNYSLLALGVLMIFIFLNLFKYLPLSLKQVFSSDPANLRTRLMVVDLIYDDNQGKGMNVFTFAPYVYDYPYQYLIWWRAKTKYQFLPEEYYYLRDQPPYVNTKTMADQLIPSKKAECDYLIIEPFESQEKWFWDWRYRFPEAKKIWEIGRTRVEKLCD